MPKPTTLAIGLAVGVGVVVGVVGVEYRFQVYFLDENVQIRTDLFGRTTNFLTSLFKQEEPGFCLEYLTELAGKADSIGIARSADITISAIGLLIPHHLSKVKGFPR
jgi:hypothetical protein